MLQPLLSPQDLADALGVPLGSIYQWNARGTGPAYSRVGKHVRYRTDEVERWLLEQQKVA